VLSEEENKTWCRGRNVEFRQSDVVDYVKISRLDHCIRTTENNLL